MPQTQGSNVDTHYLRLEAASPSLNDFTYAMSPFQQANAKKHWYYLIRGASGFLAVPRAAGKRHLTIERYGVRALDIDNLIGGAKCCITDNLVKLGLLKDDCEAWLELKAENVKLAKGEKPHTILILKDLYEW
jgi:hypothetical protein